MRPRADGGRRLCSGAAFCWRHAAGGGAGGRGLLAARRPATPRRRLSVRAGVCRSLLGRLWRRPGAAGWRPGRGVRSDPGPGGSRTAWAAWAELARARAFLLRLLSRAESRSELRLGPGSLEFLESECSEVAESIAF